MVWLAYSPSKMYNRFHILVYIPQAKTYKNKLKPSQKWTVPVRSPVYDSSHLYKTLILTLPVVQYLTVFSSFG